VFLHLRELEFLQLVCAGHVDAERVESCQQLAVSHNMTIELYVYYNVHDKSPALVSRPAARRFTICPRKAARSCTLSESVSRKT
jgi:hypothetical protein